VSIIALEDVATIRVGGFHETVRLGAELPTTSEEAQFVVAWLVALMLLDGEVGPAQTLWPTSSARYRRSIQPAITPSSWFG
jgi:hypothetical protein